MMKLSERIREANKSFHITNNDLAAWAEEAEALEKENVQWIKQSVRLKNDIHEIDTERKAALARIAELENITDLLEGELVDTRRA